MSMGSLPYGKSFVPRPLALGAGLLVVLVAAAAGWFAAGQFSDDPDSSAPTQPALKVTTGPATLTLRPGWQLQKKNPVVPGLVTADSATLAPADGGKGRMIVTMLDGATETLPPATVDTLRVPLGKAQRATFGGQRATGYTALSLKGVSGLVDVYTLKTTAGVLAVTCVAPVDDPLPAGACPADITATSVTVARRPESVDQLKAALPRLTTALNQARVSGRTALAGSHDSVTQAKAAGTLAAAYEAAASEAAKVAPRSGDGAQLPAAFTEAARSYRALQAAATSHDDDAWTYARKEVDAAERSAIAQVAQLSS
jgi:hypothetical protein